MMNLNLTDYGKVNFETYSKVKGGLTYDGKPIPTWEEVGDDVRNGWIAGAAAVLDKFVQQQLNEHGAAQEGV